MKIPSLNLYVKAPTPSDMRLAYDLLAQRMPMYFDPPFEDISVPEPDGTWKVPIPAPNITTVSMVKTLLTQKLQLEIVREETL